MTRPLSLRVSAFSFGLTLAVLAACGDDASSRAVDSSDTSTTEESAGTSTTGTTGPETSDAQEQGGASAPLGSAEDASAAQGSGLDEPPGPAERTRLDGFGEVAVAIVGTDGDVTGLCALLAETTDQRQRGLMEVTELDGYPGMLFVASLEASQSFWMRNTPMPLSIAWFDDDGRLVTAKDMEPCDDSSDCPTYSSEGPARFAFEVPQGDLDDLGIEDGSTLRVGGSCSSTS